jgi:hypothetical protein
VFVVLSLLTTHSLRNRSQYIGRNWAFTQDLEEADSANEWEEKAIQEELDAEVAYRLDEEDNDEEEAEDERDSNEGRDDDGDDED